MFRIPKRSKKNCSEFGSKQRNFEPSSDIVLKEENIEKLLLFCPVEEHKYLGIQA